MDLQLTERQGPVRCAVCHDELASPPVACEGCGAVLHAECKDAVHGCPIIGCRDRVAPAPEENKGDRERARARRFGVVAMLNGAGALYFVWLCHVLIGRAAPEATLAGSPVAIAFSGSILLGVLTLLLAARSWRGAWPGMAAMSLGCAWLLLTGPQVLDLLTWSRPLTESEVLEFVARIEKRDASICARLDVDAMIATHDPDRARLSDRERKQLRSQFHRDHVATARLLDEEGGSCRVLRGTVEGGPRIFMRRINGDFGITYQELLLARGRDGLLSCFDALELRTNDSWAARQARSSRMSRGKRSRLARIVELANAGDHEAALAVYEELQEPARSDPDFLSARLYAAQQLDAERHVAALESVIAASTGELEILRWELAVAREDHRAALLALDAIDRRVGGDPFLDGLRAEAHSALGEAARAMELANRATEALPDMEAVWWILLGCSVEARDHPRTREALERLVVTFFRNNSLEDVESAVDLTDFFASEEGEKWLFRSR